MFPRPRKPFSSARLRPRSQQARSGSRLKFRRSPNIAADGCTSRGRASRAVPSGAVPRAVTPKSSVSSILPAGSVPPGRRRRAADPRRVVFTLVEGARNNRHRSTRRRRCGRDSLAYGHRSNVRPTNRAGERRQARRYLERELGHFERYCGGTPEALPLLKEIAALKQNSDRSWDERTRKEMELAAPKIGQDHFPAGSERAPHKMSGRALVARAGPQTTRASRFKPNDRWGFDRLASACCDCRVLVGLTRGRKLDEVWRSHDRHRP